MNAVHRTSSSDKAMILCSTVAGIGGPELSAASLSSAAISGVLESQIARSFIGQGLDGARKIRTLVIGLAGGVMSETLVIMQI